MLGSSLFCFGTLSVMYLDTLSIWLFRLLFMTATDHQVLQVLLVHIQYIVRNFTSSLHHISYSASGTARAVQVQNIRDLVCDWYSRIRQCFVSISDVLTLSRVMIIISPT